MPRGEATHRECCCAGSAIRSIQTASSALSRTLVHVESVRESEVVWWLSFTEVVVLYVSELGQWKSTCQTACRVQATCTRRVAGLADIAGIDVLGSYAEATRAWVVVYESVSPIARSTQPGRLTCTRLAGAVATYTV